MKDTDAQSSQCMGNNSMKKALQITALTAGGLTLGYAVFKYYQRSSSDVRERESSIQDWLEERLLQLRLSLALSDEQREWLREQIAPVVHVGNKLWRKAERLSPDELEKAMLAAEKRLVKIKVRIRKMLELSEASQLDALHDFYEELHQIVLGLVPDVKTSSEEVETDPAMERS